MFHVIGSRSPSLPLLEAFGGTWHGCDTPRKAEGDWSVCRRLGETLKQRGKTLRPRSNVTDRDTGLRTLRVLGSARLGPREPWDGVAA